METSQQGLLQSLLYQVLLADLALVPIACLFQWESGFSLPPDIPSIGSSFTTWHEKELWGCLHAAISASDKQFCFFVDGLDELQPERSHVALAKALNQLSSYVNVKMVVSSRPWTAFERNLEHNDRVLTMEDNNRLAIIHYVQSEIEKNTTDETFSRVSWGCIYEGSSECRYMHNHGEAHNLVQTIAVRADGVFLWAALVMEAVCRHVALGCPVVVLQSYVDKLPTELSEYFQNMVFKRIHESMLSETAMALSVALLPTGGLRYLRRFALLCEYMDTGVSWLTDPDFASNSPYTIFTPEDLAGTTRKITNFLRGCCRDILYVPPQPSHVVGLGKEWHAFMYTTVDFSHRTMFDYLHTPEMQLLLDRHTPAHFKDDLLTLKLDVATCKMITIDPQGSFPIENWGQLRSCATVLASRNDLQKNETGVLHSPKILELAQMLEKACLFHLRAIKRLSTLTSSQKLIQGQCVYLSIELATFGLFDFTEALIDMAPYLLSMRWEYLSSTLFNGNYDAAFEVDMICRLLRAGGDPNLQYPCIWAALAERLNVDVVLPQEKDLVEIEKDIISADLDSASRTASSTRENTPAELSIHCAIKTLVEFGAELEPEDIEMLTKCLPKPDGHNFDWPEFFNAYSRPAKRIELEEERKKRLSKWPKGWLTRKDRRLLKSAPDLAEEWWSDRGRKLLDLA